MKDINILNTWRAEEMNKILDPANKELDFINSEKDKLAKKERNIISPTLRKLMSIDKLYENELLRVTCGVTQKYKNRYDEMVEMAEQGKTMVEIARIEGITRERVRQIFLKNQYNYLQTRGNISLEKWKKSKQRKCKFCGKEFMAGSDGTKTRYCSGECFRIFRLELGRKKAREWYKKPENKLRQKLWQQQNKDKMKGYLEKYYKTENGKEHKKEWMKKYFKTEKGKKSHSTTARKYYLANREKILADHHLYYIKNKSNKL